MGENIRLILDIMEYAKVESRPGYIMFVDFEKAFNSIYCNFVYNMCVKTFNANCSDCVLNHLVVSTVSFPV